MLTSLQDNNDNLLIFTAELYFVAVHYVVQYINDHILNSLQFKEDCPEVVVDYSPYRANSVARPFNRNMMDNMYIYEQIQKSFDHLLGWPERPEITTAMKQIREFELGNKGSTLRVEHSNSPKGAFHYNMMMPSTGKDLLKNLMGHHILTSFMTLHSCADDMNLVKTLFPKKNTRIVIDHVYLPADSPSSNSDFLMAQLVSCGLSSQALLNWRPPIPNHPNANVAPVEVLEQQQDNGLKVDHGQSFIHSVNQSISQTQGITESHHQEQGLQVQTQVDRYNPLESIIDSSAISQQNVFGQSQYPSEVIPEYIDQLIEEEIDIQSRALLLLAKMEDISHWTCKHIFSRFDRCLDLLGPLVSHRSLDNMFQTLLIMLNLDNKRYFKSYLNKDEYYIDMFIYSLDYNRDDKNRVVLLILFLLIRKGVFSTALITSKMQSPLDTLFEEAVKKQNQDSLDMCLAVYRDEHINYYYNVDDYSDLHTGNYINDPDDEDYYDDDAMDDELGVPEEYSGGIHTGDDDGQQGSSSMFT
ncbi:hypothetical protein SAMD00019534_086640 [Acytostelium subglobosum LB1]|uniref:hypothetical protein n=1 Tax=Acytostelium subglobosum LB1 TaxID=1410327 RepID=UPI000644A01A|nr:hypothetical protein SAMD00019534_086640 [Acytostelium subglobosum LB1]GAM25489.1 hypothetical protein SAMD00019534_086640 [Acytostelium subglobosum LB1]|eukprot:XP_012751475.1 hypothetical protein SAMD00019534_086640 [Acytostelium subglobosum LB1]